MMRCVLNCPEKRPFGERFLILSYGGRGKKIENERRRAYV
jgi:hypothetical protein